MNLHHDIENFSALIKTTSHQLPGGIREEFVEKDYWITLVLHRLSKAKYASETVFKGGTSLSKAYQLINRFSEDVDIAVINNNNKSGNEIKTIIRTVEKEITNELNELVMEGVTSKGSRFRKSVFEYKSMNEENRNNKLIVEVNSFANPFPYQSMIIKSFIYDFLMQTNNEKYVDEYELHPFQVNVLNKEQTLLEKLVSLIRFSFDSNAIDSISKKIRHFYDLYFLTEDKEVNAFIQSQRFKEKLTNLLAHDRQIFDEPKGWQTKKLTDSILITDFDSIWKQLKGLYISELSMLAFRQIPAEHLVADKFKYLIKHVR